MKKVLGFALALVILCAELGIFAEENGEDKATFKVAAAFKTGLFVRFTDMVDDGPFIYAGSMEKAEPMYLLVKGYYANAKKTAGIDSGFIFKGLNVETSSFDQNYDVTYQAKVDNTFGWLKMFNGILSLYGGYGEWEYDFYTPAAIDSNLQMEGLGMVLVTRPFAAMTGSGHDLRIGLSAWTKGGLTTLLNEAKYIVSASYQLNDWFKIVTNFAYRQYGPKFYADEESTSYDEQKAKDHRLNFGVNCLALSSIGFSKIAADMEVRDLGGGRSSIRDPIKQYGQEGSTVYPLYIGEKISWGNDAVNVNGTFQQLLRIGDDDPLYAPALSFSLTGSYKVASFFVPKLGVEYYMNSPAWKDFPSDMRFGENVNWEECVKDTSGLGAYVGAEFRIGGFTQNIIELGYTIRVDTSKDVKPDRRTSKIDHAVYASLTINY